MSDSRDLVRIEVTCVAGALGVGSMGAIPPSGSRLLPAVASRCIRPHAALVATSSGPMSTVRLSKPCLGPSPAVPAGQRWRRPGPASGSLIPC